MIQTYNKKPYTITFLIGQFLDILTTIIGISLLGFVEINPIFSNLSLLEIIITKSLIVFLLIIIFDTWQKFPKWAYITIICITFLPVITNTLQILLEI